MIEEVGVPSLVLMENAARGVADCAHRMVMELGRPARILVTCGTGNNGSAGRLDHHDMIGTQR